jgi:hypothetical protein
LYRSIRHILAEPRDEANPKTETNHHLNPTR